MATTSAPLGWLLAALAAALAAVAIALGLPGLLADIAAWVLAGPVALVLLTIFTLRDTKRRTAPWYVIKSSATWLQRCALVLAFAGVVVAALGIAGHVGRM